MRWSRVITFHLDGRSGVPTYLQLVHQVKRALRLGQLRIDDQLPTVREVVAVLTINPNTVLKAYRELEREGLVRSRPGLGTFVQRTLTDGSLHRHAELRRTLEGWLGSARQAGLDEESIIALFTTAVRDAGTEGVA